MQKLKFCHAESGSALRKFVFGERRDDCLLAYDVRLFSNRSRAWRPFEQKEPRRHDLMGGGSLVIIVFGAWRSGGILSSP